MIKYLLTLIALASNGESASNETCYIELPITISPLVQNAIKLGDEADQIVKKHATLFENVTFGDIVKGFKLQRLSYLRRNFAEMIQEAISHGSTVDKFEPVQKSKWTISLSVEELAEVSSNFTIPITDEVPLIVIQEAMFKVLEKKFNFGLDEIEKQFGNKKDEIYAFLEPMWIEVVKFITKKCFKSLSDWHSIPLHDIAAVLNMKQAELSCVPLRQLAGIKGLQLFYKYTCRISFTCSIFGLYS